MINRLYFFLFLIIFFLLMCLNLNYSGDIESSFFDGGTMLAGKVLIELDNGLSDHFGWQLAMGIGRLSHVNRKENYIGDSWVVDTGVGFRYYLSALNLSRTFIGLNVHGIMNYMPVEFAITNLPDFEIIPGFGYQIKIGYKWILNHYTLVDIPFRWGLLTDVGFFHYFLTPYFQSFYSTYWFYIGINLFFEFPNIHQPPKKPKLENIPITNEILTNGIDIQTNTNSQQSTNNNKQLPQSVSSNILENK